MTSRAKIVITAIATAGLLVAGATWSVIAAGVGHGSYVPMLTIFPFSAVTMALMNIGGDSSGDTAVVVATLAVIQFASYGCAIGRAWLKEQTKKAAILVGAIHAAALLCVLAVVYFQR